MGCGRPLCQQSTGQRLLAGPEDPRGARGPDPPPPLGEGICRDAPSIRTGQGPEAGRGGRASLLVVVESLRDEFILGICRGERDVSSHRQGPQRGVGAGHCGRDEILDLRSGQQVEQR